MSKTKTAKKKKPGAIRGARRRTQTSATVDPALIQRWRTADALVKEATVMKLTIEHELKQEILRAATASRSREVTCEGLKVVIRRRKVSTKNPLDMKLCKRARVPVAKSGGGTRYVINPDVLADGDLIDEIEERLADLEMDIFLEEDIPESVGLGDLALEKALAVPKVAARRKVLDHVATVTLKALSPMDVNDGFAEMWGLVKNG